GEALRMHARPTSVTTVAANGPGMLLFDSAGEVIAGNDEAHQWIAELPDDHGVWTAAGLVPIWLLITVFRAGAIRHGAGDGTARTRARTRTGRWLTCHASCLHNGDGSTG